MWFTLPSSVPVQNMAKADAHLQITMGGWNPSHIQAKAGRPLTIMLMTLASEASMSDNVHSFVLAETNTNITVHAGDSRLFTITLPSPGTYTFWCVTCCSGKASSTMAGEITAI